MKKIIILLMAALFAAPAYCADSEADAIKDIQEKPVYEKGSYAASEDTTTLNAKKGEGFDFKVPEIIITGQVDTKIMLKREITSLENLQSVKNILYENEKIYMPDYYLKEEALTPKALEMAANRDFVGQLKLLAGSYSNIFADGIIGKAFDKDNKVVVRVMHNNFDNERVNGVDTYKNINNADLYYSTKYDFVDAVYRLGGDLSVYSSPFPADPAYARSQSVNEALASAGYSFGLEKYLINAAVSYQYLGILKDGGGYVFKENRTSLKASVERDFDIDGGSKVKLVSMLDGWHANQSYGNELRDNCMNLNIFAKGILYLEPWVVQIGLSLRDFKLADNYFALNPYIKANYDILPDLSAYAEFTPEMAIPDYAAMLPGHFIKPASGIKPTTENIDLKAGVNFNFFEVFFNAYYGYKSLKDNIYLDEIPGTGIFEPLNNSLDYSFAGIELETLKLKGLTISAGYEYRNIVSADTQAVTYLPNNEFNLKLSADIFEWTFKTSAALRSGTYGTSSKRLPACAVIDLSLSRKINDFLTVEGYINNVLNNSYYLLYYYKEKLLNLGIGATLNF